MNKLILIILLASTISCQAGEVKQNKSWDRIQVFYPYDTIKEITIPYGYKKEAAIQAARTQADWLGADAIIILEYEQKGKFSLRVEAIKFIK